MELIKVKSSNVEAVGFESNNLFVKYHSGIYEFRGVSKEIYEGLLAAESKGKYLNENVKGKYPYKRLEVM